MRGEKSLDDYLMNYPWTLDIAGCSCPLTDPETILSELTCIYEAFQRRAEAYRADARNPHLCRAGCSHCCERGAFFAVTLAEALMLALAVEALSIHHRQHVLRAAQPLLRMQQEVFAEVRGPPDVPGCRDEEFFSKRIGRVSRTGASCPLLHQQLCSIYESRPFLCRAYGFPTDAYAVETDAVIVVRSLCHLYDGLDLREVIPGKDLKQHLTNLATRLGGGRHWGRFTSIEAILARVRRPAVGGTSAAILDHENPCAGQQ
ncbi:MAG TPA: YkgJ family cysteine cluster protein [Candidatus Tectomicrobia bacterium]